MMAVAAPRRSMLLKATLGTQMCPWCRTRRQVELQCQAALKGLLLAILPGDCLARSTGGAFCAPGVPKVQIVLASIDNGGDELRHRRARQPFTRLPAVCSWRVSSYRAGTRGGHHICSHYLTLIL